MIGTFTDGQVCIPYVFDFAVEDQIPVLADFECSGGLMMSEDVRIWPLRFVQTNEGGLLCPLEEPPYLEH